MTAALPEIVRLALADCVVGVGQLTAAERRHLSLYTRKGLLLRVLCYSYPNPRPMWIGRPSRNENS